MVENIKARWDFIGLSTDVKPTPAISPKVVDGSTFYCADNSKLYVYCKTQWYEKTVSGGGGTTYTAGDNITITNNVISATDTTYNAFTGTDGETAGTSGLVPAPTTSDAGKFLKADGTWDTAGGGGTLYTTTGSNTDGAMTQKATTEMVYLGSGITSPLTAQTSVVMGYGARAKSITSVCIGAYTGIAGTSSSVNNDNSVMIGRHSSLLSKKITEAVLIGRDSTVNGNTGESTVSIGSLSGAGSSCVAIGASAKAGETGSSGSNHFYDVAIGSNAKASSSTTNTGDEHKSTVSVGAKAGYYANTAQVGTVCIGGKAGNSHYGDYDVFLGSSTDASANSLNYSVALGAYSKFSRASEVSVGDGSNNANYGTRYLANVRDPQNAQDAVTKNYIDKRIIAGGTTAPTTSTAAEVGALYAYVDNGSGKLSICTDNTGGAYTWATLI